MKIKIVVSFCIFSLLLSAAWFLHQQQNHLEFNNMDSHLNSLNVVPMNNEMTPLNTNLNTENSNVQWKLYMPFRPREYVRIIAPS
jgi:flagellar basal body-associated protein FliL